MREIKFRAWDKLKERMLPVTLMDFSDWWVSCKPVIPESKEPLEYGERNSFRNEETDRHILMQYAGLKDRFEKEIYEGDVVKLKVRHYDDCSRKKLIAEEMQTGVVAFDYCSFGIKDNPEDSCLRLFSWLIGLDYEIEIMGNIYKNPELLEAKANEQSL